MAAAVAVKDACGRCDGYLQLAYLVEHMLFGDHQPSSVDRMQSFNGNRTYDRLVDDLGPPTAHNSCTTATTTMLRYTFIDVVPFDASIYTRASYAGTTTRDVKCCGVRVHLLRRRIA
jgi:hypothetical protein